MAEVESLYNMGYEQGLKDTLDKYDEIFRIASEIRIAVGCKTAKECWELARNGDIRIVKHGRWINDKGLYKCSVCNNFTITGWANCIPIEHMNKTMKYCNNCGARMDGEEND